jgi:AhpD family alkylhydroperoxidase
MTTNESPSASPDAPSCRLDTATFIPPRKDMPLPLSAVLRAAERAVGGPLIGLRALAHYPKALIGAGLLEATVCHGDRAAPKRLLALVRLTVSYAVSCPFCVDLNGADFRKLGITDDELAALRGEIDPEATGFSEAERAAIAYARAVTATPVRISDAEADRLSGAVGNRGFAIIAATAAQVNFWARLLQGLGAPPSFVAEDAAPLRLERYANPNRRQ